jgi:hypothetical protein
VLQNIPSDSTTVEMIAKAIAQLNSQALTFRLSDKPELFELVHADKVTGLPLGVDLSL